MTLVLPSPTEYARLSWPARMEAARRVREATRVLRRKQRLKREASGATSAVRQQAALILADLPRESDTDVLTRRRVLEHDYWSGRPHLASQVSNKLETTERITA